MLVDPTRAVRHTDLIEGSLVGKPLVERLRFQSVWSGLSFGVTRQGRQRFYRTSVEMRFICDVCPSTACEGHAAVIIGNYEQWVRHLLSPQHQTEQNLVMTRTSYWPQAEWIAMIKDLPAFGEGTTELFVDLMLNLSEYGFIEALYYGSRTKDSLCAALQLYETNVCPPYLMYGDGMKYDLKVAPRFPMDTHGKNIGKMGRRRQRYGSIASTLSEDSVATSVDVATNTTVDHETNADVVDSIAKKVEAEVAIDQGEREENCEKKNRIKYNRDALLEFYAQKSAPLRLQDVLVLHDIVLKEPKFIDPEQIRQPNVQWCVDTNRNFSSTRTNNNLRTPTLRHNQNGQQVPVNGNGRGMYQNKPLWNHLSRNQNGWNSQKPLNNHTRWMKDQEQVEVKPMEEEKKEEWW